MKQIEMYPKVDEHSLEVTIGGTKMISRGAWYMESPQQRRDFGKGFWDGFWH